MFTTIIVALIIFIISQYFLKFILEPMKELKQTISHVVFSIEYYANILYNINVASKEDIIEFHNEFRKLAFSLKTQLDAIPLFDKFRFFFLLQRKSNILKSVPELIGLSNTTKQVPIEIIEKRVDRIRQSLNIQSP